MSFVAWFRSLRWNYQSLRTCKARPVRPRRSVWPRLEALEDRTLPSTFTVMNLNDSGADSLRAAIDVCQQQRRPRQLRSSMAARHDHSSQSELEITEQRDHQRPGSQSAVRQRQQRLPRLRDRRRSECDHQRPDDHPRPRRDQGGGILNDGSNLTLSGDDLTQNMVFESASERRPWRGLR